MENKYNNSVITEMEKIKKEEEEIIYQKILDILSHRPSIKEFRELNFINEKVYNFLNKYPYLWIKVFTPRELSYFSIWINDNSGIKLNDLDILNHLTKHKLYNYSDKIIKLFENQNTEINCISEIETNNYFDFVDNNLCEIESFTISEKQTLRLFQPKQIAELYEETINKESFNSLFIVGIDNHSYSPNELYISDFIYLDENLKLPYGNETQTDISEGLEYLYNNGISAKVWSNQTEKD